MSHRFLKFLIAPFFLAIAFSFYSEGYQLTQKIIAKLDSYKLNRPQEKVFLHFDKPYYMAGETIWFKGYLFDGVNHVIDSVSRVLYVDLIQLNDGKIVFSIKLKAEGSTHGNISLPDSLKEGMYSIRAYTNYMRNFSDEFFFQKDFKIWSGMVKNKTEAGAKLNMAKVADLQFFPEGGNLVVDLESRLAFKAVNLAGKGINVAGFILDEKKDTVAGFKSEYLGMGKISFSPEHQKTYTAYVKQYDGSIEAFPFPKIFEQGYTMAVDNLSSKDKIKIFVTNNLQKNRENMHEFVVVAHQRGNICFIAKGNSAKKSFSFSIPKNVIQDQGVVQITLIDSKEIPICERLIFNQKDNLLNLELRPEKAIYKPREKVVVNLTVSDENGKPVKGNFSVAATDAKQVIEENEYQENILTNLLLSSDVNTLEKDKENSYLKGKVENPYYYFDKNNANANYHLDILLMTQGWRRFDWKELMSEKTADLPFFVETGIDITGKATRLNGKLANNITLTLLLKSEGQIPIFKVGTTDSLGNFGFYGFDFYDTTSVLVQAMKQNGSKLLSVKIDPPKYSPKVSFLKIPPDPMEFNTKKFADFLKNANETIEFEKRMKLSQIQILDEIVVKGKKQEESDTRRMMYGIASNTVKVNDILCAGATDVLQMIRGLVAGLQISSNGLGGSIASIRGGGEPQFLIDGFQTTIDAILVLSPCDVEEIDILKGMDAAIFGLNGGNGAINILTKRGNNSYDYSKDRTFGISVVKRLGFARPLEFYSPKYETPNPEDVNPDYRPTIHWEPNIQTDASGNASFSYWNSDAKTTVKIIANGVSDTGSLGFAKIEYLVK